MEKYLIHKKENEIAQLIERAKCVESILKSVFEKLKSMGFELNLDELEKMMQTYCSINSLSLSEFDFYNKSEKLISDYIRSLVITTHADGASIGGVKINREKFAELIEINADDLTDILSYLKKIEAGDWKFFDIIDFDSKKNTLALNPKYKEIIEDKNSFYAFGEKQIRLAKALEKIRDGVLEYDKITGRETRKECGIIEGLVWNDKILLDTNFISRY